MRCLGVACLALGSAIAGCRVYDPALLARDAGHFDAGPCNPRRPPSRPAVDDLPDGPVVAFGLRNVVLDQDGDRWRQIGYDLDGRCTQPPAYDTECTPPAGMRPEVDGDDGIDNVFGARLFPLVALTTPDLEANSRAAQEAGRGLPILRIFGWNGTPNDPRVDVHVMQAVFGAPGSDETEPPPPPADPSASRPVWDGRDWFWVRHDAFLMNDLARPLIRDDNAYVVDRLVVVRLPDRVDIIFPAGPYGVLVRVTAAIVTGRISEDGLRLENVIVSGRWAINDLLLTARNIGVCKGERDYDLVLGQLERIADVRSTPATGGPGIECDAISFGVGFTGTRLRVAGLAEGPALRDLCSDPPLDAGPGVDAGVPVDAQFGARDGDGAAGGLPEGH